MARFVNTDLFNGSETGSLQQDSVRVAHLVEVHITPTLYFTDNFTDIDYDSATAPDSGSNTYLAVGDFLTFSSTTETTQIKVNAINLSLSGVDTTLVDDLINYNIVNKRVVIYRSFFNGDAFETNRTFTLFDGLIRNWNFNEAANNSTVSVSVATHWANFEQKQGRITNSTSQRATKRYDSSVQFSGDKGFQYASAMIGDIHWGPRS